MTAVASLLLMAFARPALADWTPPIGIPQPEFGIREKVTDYLLQPGEGCASHPHKCYDYGQGLEPYRQSAPGRPYTHYIDGSNPDALSPDYPPYPLGTPSAPLMRLPQSIPAGSIVEIHGNLKRANVSPAGVNVKGTAQRPVYIRGIEKPAPGLPCSNDPADTRVKGMWEINGSYLIVENLKFEDEDCNLAGGGYGSVGLWYPSNHIAVRHNDFSGNLTGGGTGISNDNSTAETHKTEHIVYYDNIVHNGGNYLESDDGRPGTDVGGMYTGNTAHVWIVDNTCYENGVECVYGGAGYLADASDGFTRSHHIYIGRNTVYRSRQGGFGQKGGAHIVYSQNKVFGTLDNRSADGRGAGIGCQYGPEDVWFLYNDISNVATAIYVAGGTGNGGRNAYVIGNVIHDVRTDIPGTVGYAMNLYGSAYNTIMGNTIYDVQSGISLLNAHNTIANNIVSHITGPSSNIRSKHIFFNNETGQGSALIRNNLLFQPGGTALFNHSYQDYTVAQLNTFDYASDNLESDPVFTDPSLSDFRIQSHSPAIDAGDAILIERIAAQYYATFGVDIRKDLLSNNRPAGADWDIGAHEYGGSAGSQPPPQPVYHTIDVSNATPNYGRVMSAYGGLSCGAGNLVCSASLPAGLSATLVARPSSGYEFLSWSGACTGVDTACTVLMNANANVAARFRAKPGTVAVPPGGDDEPGKESPRGQARFGSFRTNFNPFAGPLEISITVDEPAHFELTVTDRGGGPVRTLVQTTTSSNQVILWDGKNSSGAHVASGLYILELKSAGSRQRKKIAVMK